MKEKNMRNKTRLLNLLVIITLFLSACNLPSKSLEDAASTAAAQTVEALLSATPVSGVATPSFTPLPSLATLTPIPLPASTNTPAATATTNCNVAQFITDVTIPDGTVMTPNQAFTKKWRIKNIGTCAWTGFLLVFDSGDSMGGPASKAISTLNPGQEVDLEVNLTAPATAGNYRGYWRINTNGNVLVPIVNGNQGKSFYVDIKVQNPATATNTPPATAQVVLNAIGSESGTLYEPAAGVPSTILAGDTGSNEIARGYMSFDISTLSGKTIKSASLALAGCSAMQDPFTGSLAGIWVGEVQYALPLDQSDYNIAGTGIVLLNALPGPIDVKSYLQTRTTEGKARFQIRLHPSGPTDNDGAADYMSCNANSVTLTISYQP
jgi:hypothetical protein